MIIRNWRDEIPAVGHQSAIMWRLLDLKGAAGRTPEQAPLEGLQYIARHAMQAGLEGDYHDHEDIEQIYYILRGKATMKIDGQNHDVREGDVVHLPPKTMHQMINDSNDWVEHIIIGVKVR